MSESGKAVRELLAALYGAVAMTPADRAVALLLVRGQAGGRTGKAAVRELIEAGRAASRRVVELEARVAELEPRTLRSTPTVMDPPAGHGWATGDRSEGDAAGRLYCVTCTLGGRDGDPVTLAAECLERSR